jgi:hypothetical protein
MNVVLRESWEGMGKWYGLIIDGVLVWSWSAAMDRPLEPEGQSLVDALQRHFGETP